MEWTNHFQLFLFDFDGLLVDTEHLHYQAYIDMCANRGFHLNWSFSRYSEAAHHHATALRDQIYSEFPSLQQIEPNWNVLYQEKKNLFLSILESQEVPLMPGAADLLIHLEKLGIKRCVVTHSSNSLVARIREKNPVLNTIPHWITREDYTHPKPHSECYQYAIQKHKKEGDKVIGFEDSPRGLKALLGTVALPVLICPPDSPYLPQILSAYKKTQYYPSFQAITNLNAPIK